MKHGPITKLDKKNAATSKKLTVMLGQRRMMSLLFLQVIFIRRNLGFGLQMHGL